VSRFEYKYLVNPDCLPALRDRFRPFVLPDSHALRKPRGRYTIRSIYFDTRNLRDYHEKLSGIERRKKLRFRVYDQFQPASVGYLEVKRKKGDLISKQRAPLLVRDAAALLASGDIGGYIIVNDGVAFAAEHARNFLYHLTQGAMIPTVLVTYEREPWVGKFDAGFRLTFDTSLRFAPFPNLCDLYRESGLVCAASPPVIMEVKFNNGMPLWVWSIIAEFGLRRTSLSKYCTGIDLSVHGVRPQAGLRELRSRPFTTATTKE
jgi:hypothetical protein